MKTLATTNVESGSKLREHRGWKILSEDACKLCTRQNVMNTDIPDNNALTDEVKIDLNMLCVLVLNRVDREVGGIDVVAVDKSTYREGIVELPKDLAASAHFSHTIGNNAVLSLSAGAGDHELTLGEPEDEVIPNEHGVARDGPPGVRATCLVNVGVDDQLCALRALFG